MRWSLGLAQMKSSPPMRWVGRVMSNLKFRVGVRVLVGVMVALALVAWGFLCFRCSSHVGHLWWRQMQSAPTNESPVKVKVTLDPFCDSGPECFQINEYPRCNEWGYIEMGPGKSLDKHSNGDAKRCPRRWPTPPPPPLP